MKPVAEHISRSFIGAVEDAWQLYSNSFTDYTIGLPIGFGASSIVYAATYQPPDGAQPIPCAIKVLDLDRLPQSALRLLQNETQLMSLSKHPNVLRVRGTWVDGHKLYIAMRLMNAGSVADVMRYQWPEGLHEEVIRCILNQALQGLNYFHINGLIHRDVKAANLLIDDDGTVLLGDLGVAAFLWDSEGNNNSPLAKPRTVDFDTRLVNGNQRGAAAATLGKRKSFVGTPCWMAPEVIDSEKQYDASADIWSFGITAVELAQGRAPRSRMNPQKVLVMTVTEAPPQLERKSGKNRYSSAFEEVVKLCLNKDPSKRPTASELLQMPFFRNAKKPSYLCSTILRDLPPLTHRQERRKQPSILTHLTMESWDFASSLPASPTTSVYSHHPRPLNFLPSDNVFEIEDSSEEDVPLGSNGDENHAVNDGHSSAEAYAMRIRARNPPRLSTHSRSNSYQSSHSHRSHYSHPSHHHHHHHHSRHQSHDEQRLTVHSIQEAVARDSSGEGERSSDTDCEDKRGIPVAVPAQSAGSATPDEPPSKTAPSASSSPSFHSSLWRRLAGKESEKDKEPAQPRAPASSRKRSFGAVLGRTPRL